MTCMQAGGNCNQLRSELGLGYCAMSGLPKIALVVGQTDYTGLCRLPKAERDAGNMANKLEACGFKVIRAFNVTRLSFLTKLTDLEKRVSDSRPKPLVLFYYAGHGAEYHNISRLLSTEHSSSTNNAEYDAAAVVQAYSIGIDEVLRHMKGADRCVMILDACRINPLPGATDGTTRISVPEPCDGFPPTLWAYACWNGSTTTDTNSFSSILLQELFKPGVTLNNAVGRANELRGRNPGPVLAPYPHKFDFSLTQGYDPNASPDLSLPADTEHQIAAFAGEELQNRADTLEKQLRNVSSVIRNHCMMVVENRTQWELGSPKVEHFKDGELIQGFGVKAIQPMTGDVFAYRPRGRFMGSEGCIKYQVGDTDRFFYLHWDRPGPEGNDPSKAGWVAALTAHVLRFAADNIARFSKDPSWKAVIDRGNLPARHLRHTGMDPANKDVCNTYCVEGLHVSVSGKMEELCTGLSRITVKLERATAPAPSPAAVTAAAPATAAADSG